MLLSAAVLKSIPPVATPLQPERVAVYASDGRHFAVNPEMLRGFESGRSVRPRIGGVVDLARFGGKLVLAGGALVSLLLQQPVNDYDLFFCDCGPEEALDIMQSVLRDLRADAETYRDQRISLFATPTCYTFAIGRRKLQFIFRRYRNLDEILLGFDLDCCCIAFDGRDIHLSRRCEYALQHHANHVDLSRASPTYELRLVKYSRRGFDVVVPDFDADRVLRPVVLSASDVRLSVDVRTGTMTVHKKSAIRRSRYRRTGRAVYHTVSSPNSSNGQGTFAQWLQRQHGSDNDEFEDADATISSLPVGLPSNTVVPSVQAAMQAGQDVVWKRKNEPLMRLSGLSVLLFLSTGLRGTHRLRVSDYGERADSAEFDRGATVRVCYVHGASNLRVASQPGRFLRASVCGAGQLDWTFVMDLCLANGVQPQWVVQNPGAQITSSFHALAFKHPRRWYVGPCYRDEDDDSSKLQDENRDSVQYIAM